MKEIKERVLRDGSRKSFDDKKRRTFDVISEKVRRKDVLVLRLWLASLTRASGRRTRVYLYIHI